jgi:N6-L-threonylcarbamoyladenine synthase
MRILSIETSCDETAIALVEASGNLRNPKFKILKNLIASQIKIHRPFGGVVPNLAKREHLKNLPILLNKILANSSKSKIKNQKSKLHLKSEKFLNKIDLICVTVGPGLEPALWTGINFAKELYSQLKTHSSKLKLMGVSHLDGHLYSNLLSPEKKISYPAINLIVSGGHTILLLAKDLTHYEKIGETRDDAVGECFDKVARLLNLPYPGGPEIEKLAKRGNPDAIKFPRPMMNQKNYDFSFSGLKTSVLYYLRDIEAKQRETIREIAQKNIRKNSRRYSQKFASDVAASFQKAAFDVLISKTLRAAKEYKVKTIMISGGVASNNSLKNCLKLRIKKENLKINLIAPSKKFCTDNAAMIAAAGYVNFLKNKNRRLIARGDISV